MNSKDEPATGEEPEELTWTVWPAAKRPWQAVAVAAFCLALSGAAMWSFGSGAYAMVTLVVLFAFLWQYFFPVRYTVGAEGVSVHGLLVHRVEEWANVRACFDFGPTLIVSRSRDLKSRLAKRKSVFLLLPGDAARVRRAVARHVQVTVVDSRQ